MTAATALLLLPPRNPTNELPGHSVTALKWNGASPFHLSSLLAATGHQRHRCLTEGKRQGSIHWSDYRHHITTHPLQPGRKGFPAMSSHTYGSRWAAAAGTVDPDNQFFWAAVGPQQLRMAVGAQKRYGAGKTGLLVAGSEKKGVSKKTARKMASIMSYGIAGGSSILNVSGLAVPSDAALSLQGLYGEDLSGSMEGAVVAEMHGSPTPPGSPAASKRLAASPAAERLPDILPRPSSYGANQPLQGDVDGDASVEALSPTVPPAAAAPAAAEASKMTTSATAAESAQPLPSSVAASLAGTSRRRRCRSDPQLSTQKQYDSTWSLTRSLPQWGSGAFDERFQSLTTPCYEGEAMTGTYGLPKLSRGQRLRRGLLRILPDRLFNIMPCVRTKRFQLMRQLIGRGSMPESGRLFRLDLLLRRNRPLINRRSKVLGGMSPFQYALCTKNWGAIRLMMKLGASPTKPTLSGQSPLVCLLAGDGRVEEIQGRPEPAVVDQVLEWLTKGKKNINAVGRDAKTVLDHVVLRPSEYHENTRRLYEGLQRLGAKHHALTRHLGALDVCSSRATLLDLPSDASLPLSCPAGRTGLSDGKLAFVADELENSSTTGSLTPQPKKL